MPDHSTTQLRTATKHYAITLKTDTVVRRKIAIAAKINQTLVAEAEVDEIAGAYSLIFAPNDMRLMRASVGSDGAAAPPLLLMWRYRSFNLLLSQQNELHLSGLELSPLESDDREQVAFRYSTSLDGVSSVSSSAGATSSSASSSLPAPSSTPSAGLVRGGFSGHLALTRNQWHKFEGKLMRLAPS